MDRIDDAYNGLMGEAFMRKTQARMHWICAQIDGVKVLDVGCSQGTLARLLATSGKSVLGVDVSDDAISYAESKLPEMDASSRQRLRFVSANFLDVTTEERFDTVVMGEVLEHLLDPVAFVKKAWECLSDGGTCVITVPFGINDDPDHKQTFYWTWIREIVAPYFDVKAVKFFGKWIGVVGVRRVCRGGIDKKVSLIDVKELEEAFFAMERPLVDEHKARGLKLKSQAESSAAKVNDLNSKLSVARSELAAKCAEAAKLASENSVLTEKIKTVDALRQVRYEQDKQLIQECSVLKAKIASLEADLKSAQESAKCALAELASSKSSLAKCQERLSETLSALAKSEAKLTETSSALAKSEAKQTETSSALAKSEAEAKAKLAAAAKAREALAKRIDFLERSLKNADARYQQLALSKFGRLTLWYWRHKDALKARLGRGKPVVRPVVPAKSATPARPVAPAKSAGEAPATPKKLPCGDEGFFARMSEKIKDMPESNGCRYYERLKRRIAVVCDQFYWDSVKAAADFVYIDPAKWQDCIKDIDCLLIVSAWHGLGSGTDWQGLAYEGTKRRALAYEIIDTCKERGIPTIFYSKEDPPSYAEFLGLAKRCDCVFTSDDGCVARYLADCGHDRVFPLRFCINPTYHNPVGTRYRTKERNVFFAGSWMTKFPERCTDMERMLDGVLEAGRGLNIVDRCYNLRNDERYRYPEKYLKYQAPAVDHDSLQKIHKLYDWCININTVKDSNTMFANRVYELQANGNLLVSNYSLGVSNTFPNVFMIHDKKEVGLILNGFTDDEIYERQTAGVRRVMTGETCYDRVAEMLRAVGLADSPPARKVLVIATKTTDRVKEMFELQTYEAKTLTDLDHVTPEMYAAADIVAFFGADADYGAYYLEDMINGFKYTNCDYVTKAAYVNETGTLVEGKEHDYVSAFADRTRTVFWRDAFTLEELLGATGAVKRENGYASDHFSYALRPQTLPRIENPAVSAVIPVYNNGRFLYGRSFAALRRSSLFPRMEIIIVDDGSTDGWTPKVVRELERRYPNVRTYFFDDGGSGSPSRPRNQGVKMAKAPCIIFHDPDNEGIMDGYAALYDALQRNPENDLTIGNTVRCDGHLMTFDYYGILKKCARGVSFTNCRKMVAASNFLPANIQTMAIRRDFLLENGLEQVPGGIGEDSLLCNQMMFAARRIEVVPVKVQIYYAERGDSIVNSVTTKFFDKHMLTEVARVKWIVPAGLMKDYVKNRYATYVTGWYFEKLRHADPELADECAHKLFDILKLYDGYYKGGCEAIDTFLAKCRAGDFHGAYEAVVEMKKKK
ncbi:MAG: methyltransferase domain-containing protein [Kiritimatiellae bacterium]|nr:methyltransferase domain-containing protein [Kiritimatiellia bacterium]